MIFLFGIIFCEEKPLLCPLIRPTNCTGIPNMPVCGFYDPTIVECLNYPCARNFDNSCLACMDPLISEITCEVCPHLESNESQVIIRTNIPVFNNTVVDNFYISQTEIPQCEQYV